VVNTTTSSGRSRGSLAWVSIYQQFFERCGTAGTTVAITDGWIDEVRPDGIGKLIADISAAVIKEERRRSIKWIEAGVSRAQRQCKWLGNVPAGFPRDGNGYLQVILVLDREAGETGYLELLGVLERVGDDPDALPDTFEPAVSIDLGLNARIYFDSEQTSEEVLCQKHGPAIERKGI